MKLIYSSDEIPNSKNSIFLAGPTPRSKDVISWRKEAIKLLEKTDFDGYVIIPEDRDLAKPDYVSQALWERKGLEISGAILFWVPRDLETLPAFTTNVEFGKFVPSGKTIYGRPNDAPKNKYLDWFYEYETSKKPLSTLEETIDNALEFLKSNLNDNVQ